MLREPGTVTGRATHPADAHARRRAAEPVDADARRSVAPGLVGRSLWIAAPWTAVGAAFVCAVAAIVAVAVCWLPAAGTSGNAGSAIRAGLLTVLAGLHGGVTIDGTHAIFVPLGITAVIGAVAWRSGTGLADVAADLGERDPRRLLLAGAAQAATFAVTVAVVAAFAGLGTSSVSPLAAALAGLVLWLVTGGGALVRHSALAEVIAASVPWWWQTVLRVAVAALTVYLGCGAVLAGASVALHWHQVSLLSHALGSGWAGAPVLLLGVLAAPNAAVAAAGYLSGPGFTVGSGTAVRLGSSGHGRLPDFPLLGALPGGTAGVGAWLLVAVTPLLAGCCLTALVRRSLRQRARPLRQWRDLGLGLLGTAVLAAVTAWAAGGGIGDAGLAAVGVPPWQLGLAVAVGAGAGSAVVLGTVQAFAALRHRHPETVEPPLRATLSLLRGEPDTIGLRRTASADAEGSRPTGTSAREGDELAG